MIQAISAFNWVNNGERQIKMLMKPNLSFHEHNPRPKFQVKIEEETTK